MMRWFRENRGSVSVFLLCILLPMIVFESFAIDGAKLIVAKSTARNAANLAMDGALAGFNTEIQRNYGLFVATKSQAQMNTEVNRYFSETINPGKVPSLVGSNNGNFLNMSGTVSTSYEGDSQISNLSIFEDQIKEFMSYRCMGVESGTRDLTPEMITSLKYVNTKCQILKGQLEYDKQIGLMQQELNQSYGDMIMLLSGSSTNSAKIANNIQSAINRYKSLPNYKSAWLALIQNSQIPDSYRQGELNQYNRRSCLIDISKLNVVCSLFLNGEFTPEALAMEEVQYYISLCAVEADIMEGRPEAFDDLYTRFEVGDIDNLTLELEASIQEAYGDINAKQYGQNRIATRGDNFEVIMDNAIACIEDMVDFYSNAEIILTMMDDIDYVYVEEYFSEMFACFHPKNDYSISGRLYTGGDMPCANSWSEVEYIAFGNSDPLKNCNITKELIFCTRFMMNTFYYMEMSDPSEIFEESRLLAGGVTYERYMAEDAILISKAARKARQQTVDTYFGTYYSLDPEEGPEMRYLTYLKLFVWLQMVNDKSIMLTRALRVIELSAKYSPNATAQEFKADTAYTSISIQGSARIQTTLMRSVANYTNGGFVSDLDGSGGYTFQFEDCARYD